MLAKIGKWSFITEVARDEIKAARDEIAGLCNGTRKWTMCVPVDRERDSDMVLSHALDIADNLLTALETVPSTGPATLVAASAPELLTKAASIMEERGKQYDQPGGERSMGKAVDAFNTITGQDLTEAEGWLLLQILKDVRLWQRAGYHQDSAEDCIAYAALKAEAKQKEVAA